jgi:predicted O-methyltransferase YrrM
MNTQQIAEIAQGRGRADESLVSKIKAFSMLHHETLRILWELAAMSRGPILELGPYIGGSTVALAKGAAARGTPIISVEKGGSHADHPYLPSVDILADLRKTLSRYGVADQVTILEGHNDAPEIVEAVARRRRRKKLGLLFIDADGQVERDFKLYKPYLRDGAFIVFDDYEMEEDWGFDKSHLVRPFVGRGIADGFFSDLDVYQWGTWVGIYRKERTFFSWRHLRARLGL